jgi:hypothetical protein
MGIHKSNAFIRHLLQVGGLDLTFRIGWGYITNA